MNAEYGEILYGPYILRILYGRSFVRKRKIITIIIRSNFHPIESFIYQWCGIVEYKSLMRSWF